MVNAFIDSNIIANWLMINERHKIIDNIIDKKERKKKDLEFKRAIENHKYQKSSYEFIEKVKDRKSNHNFFVSELVFNEIFSVMLEEYVAQRLIKDGIPIRFWSKNWNTYKERANLSKEDSEDIVNTIDGFFHIFIDTRIIKRADERYNRKALVDMIILNKIDTHDSSIVAIAIENKCEYLITEDQRLKRRVQDKKYKDINVVNSRTFMLKFLSDKKDK